jgi:nicotinamide phosphoribosyltransferase
MTQLKFNPFLDVDSYKLSHSKAYQSNVNGMFSYIEARTGGRDTIVPFGLQMWIQKFLSVKLEYWMIDEAATFAQAHGEPFDVEAFTYLVQWYEYFPVTIKAVPEGTPVPSGNAIVTIECTDAKLFWLASYLETALLRAVWYPTTIASADYAFKKELEALYRKSGAPLAGVAFALHDFGARGVTCAEQAEIGGAAHLVNFMGSDTIGGIRAANFYYNDPMAAFSVPATEHSIECSFGGSSDEEEAYLSHVLDTYAKPGAIVSIVIDGYDVYRAANTLCTKFKYQIIASGAKVVFRPDSGDMFEVVPRILEMQEAAFGTEMVVGANDNVYYKIKHVGVLQGDGIDRKTGIALVAKAVEMGFTADSVVLGSGGGLLQAVTRDTYKFAQKASAVRKGDSWVGIAKNPITDPGKKSKEGRLTLVRSRMTGEYMTVPLDFNTGEYEEVLKVVYKKGEILNKTTLAEVRARCAS